MHNSRTPRATQARSVEERRTTWSPEGEIQVERGDRREIIRVLSSAMAFVAVRVVKQTQIGTARAIQAASCG
jgi:hypothetical protein